MNMDLSYESRKEIVAQLPSDAYWVLSVLSIAGYPLESYTIHRILGKMGIQPETQRTFTDTVVKKQLEWLAEEGFIDHSNSRFPCVELDWREPAARVFYLNSRAQVKPMVRHLQRESRIPNKYSFYLKDEDQDDLLRIMRLHFFGGDISSYEEQLRNIHRSYGMSREAIFAIQEESDGFFLPPDASFIAALPLSLQEEALNIAVEYMSEWDSDTPQQLGEILNLKLAEGKLEPLLLRTLLSHVLAMQGYFTSDSRLLLRGLLGTPESAGLEGFLALLKQDWETADQAFAQIAPKGNRRLPNQLFGVVYVLNECRKRNMRNLGPLWNDLIKIERSYYPGLFNALRVYSSFILGEEDRAVELVEDLLEDDTLHPIELLFTLLVGYWIGAELEERIADRVVHLMPIWEASGMHWLCGEMANILYLHFPEHPESLDWKTTALAIADKHQFHYLAGLLPRQEPWERILNALERVSSKKKAVPGSKAAEGAKRTIWLVNFEKEELKAKEQKMSKRGKWSAGRKIKLSELAQENVYSMSLQDKEVKEALRRKYGGGSLTSYYYYPDSDLALDFGHALHKLIGHPYLFLDSKEHIPLELREGKPELIVEEQDGEIRMVFRPYTKEAGYVVEKETPTRYKVYYVSENDLEIAKAIGRKASVPASGKERVEQILQGLQGQVNVQSPMSIAEEDIEKVAGDPLPCLHLLPFGEGFKLEGYVKPLHPESHYFKPGKGLSTRVLSTADGKVACERPLEEESRLAEAVVAACPTLQKSVSQDYEWQIDDTEACLQVLMELFPLKEAGSIRLEHPKGERVRLSAITDMDKLSMQISKQRDWFAVGGEVQLDENQVLDFQRLLEHIRESDSPFVELGNGEFAALTENFRKRLKELDGMLHQRGKKVELPALAGFRLDEIAEEMAELEVDMEWAERMQRIQKAQRIRPRVPNSFQAELRNYQQEGFRWMMRLAEWGVGGCLADDMGLGKTIQALAVLCARQEEGASLVVAPASVTRNWLRETERFAPSLKPHLLASSKDIDLIDQVGAGDLLLVSYGLLPFVGEALAEKQFANIVLDEAQAIKNAATKRSKMAMKLQGDFRLATTGTPIENHLGELWSLFRFLNPGLLGSQRHFSDKFGKPIGRDGDEERREQLRKLIQPFILRRRKSEVLTELPPKTEITLNVELSEPELAFYEALRRRALEEIEAADDTSKRFTLLAQLTRLRQAACHPILADANSHLQSSKLELVGETILEILENGHKALVFSQFVKHLRLVEQWVKQAGIPYQYLDGQTPGKKREAAVNAFQNGEGQLFLISLKAGGTGLNLTAADFVLHLDPWWNPAVEDQASDRAHRIGQQRPVTVYRFVSEHTIEEKIVALHQEKRELADQLLAGTDRSAKLSVEEMIKLIQS
jgi:superfamily II DNA or RNA helicase